MKHRPCGNGKGDTPRPIQDREKFDNNWDAIFGKGVKAAAKSLSDYIDNEALKELNKEEKK